MIDRERLTEIVATGLDAAVRADVAAMAESLVSRHGETIAAILFYGSALRRDDADVLPDLYVLVDGYRAFHRKRPVAAAGRLMPPNVLFYPANAATNRGFKVAVISRRQFRARMRACALDTTLWARFCQPAAVVHCRDEAVRRWLDETLADAVCAAVHWAIRLGPEEGTAREYWTCLFRHTYGAELRVEGGGRAGDIHGFAAGRFDALLAAAGAGELGALAGGRFRRRLPAAEIVRAVRAWRRRRLLGKVLNVARLGKALFTFQGGVDYIVWKLERHSGQTVALTPWQKRHPLAAAPFVLASLIRRGVVR